MNERPNDIVTLSDVYDHLKGMDSEWGKEVYEAAVVLVYATLNQNFITSSLVKRLPYSQDFMRKCIINYQDNGLWVNKWVKGRCRTFWTYNIDDMMELGLCGMCGIGEVVTNKLPHIIAKRNETYRDGFCYRELPKGVDTKYQAGEIRWGEAAKFWKGELTL